MICFWEQFKSGIEIDGNYNFKKEIGTLGAGEKWEKKYPIDVRKPVTYSGVAYAETSADRIKSREAS